MLDKQAYKSNYPPPPAIALSTSHLKIKIGSSDILMGLPKILWFKYIDRGLLQPLCHLTRDDGLGGFFMGP
ncbi:MAG: hypothetical protein M0036_24775, partial [Desulfobacteraceae bacterium]|nr:hypothetical protein [Desulfobacteraceae bacterium]